MRGNRDQNTQWVFYVDLHTNTESVSVSSSLGAHFFEKKRKKCEKREKSGEKRKSGENETKRAKGARAVVSSR